jgi:hypothetical protein
LACISFSFFGRAAAHSGHHHTDFGSVDTRLARVRTQARRSAAPGTWPSRVTSSSDSTNRGRLTALGTRRAGIPIGLIARALTTTVGVNGPPLVIWLRAQRATLIQLRDTLAIIFLTVNLAAIPSIATHGGTIPTALLPSVAADLIIGHVHQHLPTRTLDRTLITILTTTATASVLAGATGCL